MIFVCKKCCSSPSVRQRDLALTYLTHPVGVGVGVDVGLGVRLGVGVGVDVCDGVGLGVGDVT